MEGITRFFSVTKDVVVRFFSKLSDRSFIIGFVISFWPTLYFFFLVTAHLVRNVNAQPSDFLESLSTLPILLIFYEGLMFLMAAGMYMVYPAKRFPRGLAFGVGTTIGFIVLLALGFFAARFF